MNTTTAGGGSLSLLVAVDGSVHSDAALHWLAGLGVAQKVLQCVILHVQKPVMTGEVGVILPASIAMAERAQQAKSILEAAASVLRAAGLVYAVEQKIDNDAASAALACAGAYGCDAIVVGRRGRGALRAALLGSVSASVVRQATLPVIVVNTGDAHTSAEPLRILVACDGSAAARHAATAAAHFARQAGGSDIHLMHVRSDLTLAGAIFGPRERLLQHWSGSDGERAIAEVRAAIERAGCNCTVLPVIGDHPGDKILRATDKLGCGMVAMGTRGLGLVGGMLLGSVAQYVVERSRVPVLLTR